jgi:ribonuclease HII
MADAPALRRARPFSGAEAAALPPVIGCDEVGRGALCGPVVVAAVWFEPRALPVPLLAALDDSKRLTRPERERLAPLIRGEARVALAAGSAAAVDRLGLLVATLSAMRRAVTRLGLAGPVRVDGRDRPEGLEACEAVIGGDRLCPQIAAASILAKVARDRLMRRLAVRHPGYGWETNVGYGTADHRAALTRLGPTRHHRMRFAPCAGAKSEAPHVEPGAEPGARP